MPPSDSSQRMDDATSIYRRTLFGTALMAGTGWNSGEPDIIQHGRASLVLQSSQNNDGSSGRPGNESQLQPYWWLF